jgi:transposase-like protein
MRLKLLLPKVEPDVYGEPEICPQKECNGQILRQRQEVPKAVRDTVFSEVVARRYECLRCGATFRVYPIGVCPDQISRRLKGVAVMLYIMGLSYGAVALVLEALGWSIGKTTVYETVQAAGEKVPGLRRDAICIPVEQVMVAALGVDLTSVKCKGEWLTLGVGVDASEGMTLAIDILENGEAETLTEWVEEMAAVVGAEVVVTDDADGFKRAADENGLDHQVCKSHVLRSTEAWIDSMRPKLADDADGSLTAIGVSPKQAVADCDTLMKLVRERRRSKDVDDKLEEIHMRYIRALTPQQLGANKATLAYRLRLFSLDRWNLWQRLTLYRNWSGSDGSVTDGTNNACERSIGWWIKERYRTMRGYKRSESVLNVSRLIAWAGNQLDGTGANLATLLA